MWDFQPGVYICSIEVTSIYKLSTIATDVQHCVVNIVESIPANWRRWKIQSYGKFLFACSHHLIENYLLLQLLKNAKAVFILIFHLYKNSILLLVTKRIEMQINKSCTCGIMHTATCGKEKAACIHHPCSVFTQQQSGPKVVGSTVGDKIASHT